MEDHLYNQLKKYNQHQKNNYRDNWGTALFYLEPSQNVVGKMYDEAQLYNRVNEHFVGRKPS